jgi:hypothetical protein
MSRKTLLGVAASALVISAPVALAAPNNKDRVIGSGFIGSVEAPNQFNINAQSGPNGEDPKGTAHYHQPQADNPMFLGKVVCLRVQGNRASLIIEDQVERNQGRFSGGGGAVIFVEDNGKSPGGPPVDRQQNRRIAPEDFDAVVAQGCPEPMEPRTLLLQGDIQVDDATP